MTLDRLEKRIWLAVYGAASLILADIAYGLLSIDCFLREGVMIQRIGGFGSLETKFRSFDGELALKEGAEIAGYASLFGAADQGGDVVQKGAYGGVARAAREGAARA